MALAKISSKGQIIIPSKIRARHCLKSGSMIEILDFGKEIVLVPMLENPMSGARGLLKLRQPLPKIMADARKESVEKEARKK
jgi:AbrB family looped-hinge helix DNA binding protein